MGRLISINTISLSMPVGNPGSLVSARDFMINSDFFFILATGGGSTKNWSPSAPTGSTNKNYARPMKSEIADLREC